VSGDGNVSKGKASGGNVREVSMRERMLSERVLPERALPERSVRQRLAGLGLLIVVVLRCARLTLTRREPDFIFSNFIILLIPKKPSGRARTHRNLAPEGL
jgi:hypothetical protein